MLIGTEYIVSPVEPLTIIPDALESTVAAPLLCGLWFQSFKQSMVTEDCSAGVTIYSAIMKANLKPGQWLVLPGAGGGLGHL
jgi:propanol-preferring alcohol dehydrogenase